MCTLPPPSTISRRTPRAERSSLSQRMSTGWPPSTTVATGPSRARASATRGARAVDELLGVAGGEEVGARVELRPPGHGHLDRRRRAARGPPARPAAPASAPAAAGCRSGPWPRRPGSRRRWRGRRRRGRSRRRWTAAAARRRAVEVAVDRHAAAEQRVRAVSHGGSVRLRDRRGQRRGALGRAGRRRARGAMPRARTSGAREAGDQHHHAVDDGGGDALGGAQPGGGERPRRRALAWPPAADVGQHHRQQHEQRQRQQPRDGAVAPAVRAAIRKVAAWPARPRRRQHDAGPGPPGQQPVADVAGRRAAQPAPIASAAGRQRPASEHEAERPPDQRDARPAAWTSAPARAARAARPP